MKVNIFTGGGGESDPEQLTCNLNVHSFSANKFFSVLYFNCRSLLPKIDELAALCAANKHDIVLLKHGMAWLSANVLNSEVAIHNYSLIRLDTNRHGGGVAIVFCTILCHLALLSWNLLLFRCASLVLNYI